MKNLKNFLHRLYQHMAWADRRVLECLRNASEPESVRLFAHVLAAEQVWLARLQGHDSSSLAIWPDSSLEDCEAAAEHNRAAFAHYLDALPEAQLTASVVYRNSAGVSFSTAVQDILTHVALHGSYHRGQIAARVRSVGDQPVNTDFINFVREERALHSPLA